MERVRCIVDIVFDQALDAKSKIVVFLNAESFPVQDKLDDSGMNGGREKCWRVNIKPTIRLKLKNDTQYKIILFTTLHYQVETYRYSLSLL